MRLTFTKYHIWLGWLAGGPILIWMVSGLFMALKPIEQVRGEHLRTDPPVLAMDQTVPVAPLFDSDVRPVSRVELVQQATGPVWLIRYQDGGGRRAAADTGEWLAPELTGAEAAEIARAAYAGDNPLTDMRKFGAEENPFDLRRGRPAWRARFGTSTNLYVDAETGEVLALRTGWWRAFDFMWGLHIMDLGEREDTSHPILIGSAILALLMSLLGLIILPWRYIRKRRVKRRS
ncbi:MAG: PepSY domain-containing protein [Parasphingopyxis sp.]